MYALIMNLLLTMKINNEHNAVRNGHHNEWGNCSRKSLLLNYCFIQWESLGHAISDAYTTYTLLIQGKCR